MTDHVFEAAVLDFLVRVVAVANHRVLAYEHGEEQVHVVNTRDVQAVHVA